MYLSPLIIKAKTRPYRQFYNMPRLPTIHSLANYVLRGRHISKIVCLFFEGKHTTGTKTEGKIRNYVLSPLVDVRGVEPRSYQIISYTLYFLCKCPDDQSEHSI